MRRLMAAMSQTLEVPATRKARPRTYRREVPQSPKSSPAACHQLTFRGRSLLSRDKAGGSARSCLSMGVCSRLAVLGHDFSRWVLNEGSRVRDDSQDAASAERKCLEFKNLDTEEIAMARGGDFQKDGTEAGGGGGAPEGAHRV